MSLYFRSGLLAYHWQICWLVIVTWIAVDIYDYLYGLIPTILLESSISLKYSYFTRMLTFNDWTLDPLYVLGLVLLWWRIVKVVVLHGAPFTFGLQVSHGRDRSSGRLTTHARIRGKKRIGGITTEFIWLGAIMRSHPSSDKIVRSRLQMLFITILPNVVVDITESRLTIRRMTNQMRRDKYELMTKAYL